MRRTGIVTFHQGRVCYCLFMSLYLLCLMDRLPVRLNAISAFFMDRDRAQRTCMADWLESSRVPREKSLCRLWWDSHVVTHRRFTLLGTLDLRKRVFAAQQRLLNFKSLLIVLYGEFLWFFLSETWGDWYKFRWWCLKWLKFGLESFMLA